MDEQYHWITALAVDLEAGEDEVVAWVGSSDVNTRPLVLGVNGSLSRHVHGYCQSDVFAR